MTANKSYYQNDYYCLNGLDKPQILFNYYPPLHVQTTMNQVMMKGQDCMDDDFVSSYTLRRKRDCCIREEKCKCVDRCNCRDNTYVKKDNGCGCGKDKGCGCSRC